MSLALLHILVMGFVLVLVLVVVLESFPAEWWSGGVMEYRSVALSPNWVRLVTRSARTR